MGKNRICELLGIRYPIIQAPMNWVSGADLVAAVSKAGGLGTIGPNAGSEDITPDVELTGERMRTQIRKVKSLTDAPFAVNVVAGFGDISEDNRNIIKMEWIVEGVSLIFIGTIVGVVTYIGPLGELSRAVYTVVVAGLLALALVSLFTGFKVRFLPFRLCPFILTISAVLIFLGGVL